ncbi:MAG TPA: beta-ketoacyl-ACP synthase III [Solirubrobacteraceae bacterium]|jgi:3-oxoacyl-[acyl-carrier-protein] synthase-3|nr:beta-ketoacyl-ACP synthase III [Solirubrobacteraceae bacterium]
MSTPDHAPDGCPAPTITGIGAALPSRLITNAALVERLDTSDEWIVRRTGIRERRHLSDGESLSDLAAAACAQALEDAGLDGAEVDHLICATITPDRLTPGIAPATAAKIGADHAGVVDINAACAGFLYGLDQAAALIESGRATNVLVCGAEALSRITDHEDRSTAVLFGDGAGAVVVSPGAREPSIGSFVFGYDATLEETLFAERDTPLLRMAGQQVYRHAVARMTEATELLLQRNGVSAADVDYFVAHQANARIVSAVAESLGVPLERVSFNVEWTANTSAASIPLALAAAERDGLLHPGALVGMVAFGAGFVWAAGLARWKANQT